MGRVRTVLLLMGLLLSSAPLPAAEPPSLLVLPFEISGQERLDYLKDSILDLLASRIGQGSGVSVVTAEKVKEALRGRPTLALTDQEALDLARSLGADYLLFGRFTKIGEWFSLDAGLLEVRSGQLAGRFVAEGEGMSRLIPKVGELAESVRSRFTTLATAPPAPTVGRVTPPPPGQLLPGGVGTPGKAWVSRPLPLEIRGIGIGDVNRDGANEIVVLTKEEVQVYRWQPAGLQLLTRYTSGSTLEHVSVDVADFNGNGTAEIYVTALAVGNSLSSFVLEWSGSGLRPIASRMPWYFRVIRLNDGPALVGQTRARDRAFTGPLRRFVWRGGNLVPGEALPLPGHVTLYSFAVADLDGDGRPEVASLQSRTPLTVYGPQGNVIGRGGQYGQTALFLVEVPSTDGNPEEGLYLPGRILAVNLPGQGTGLLVSRNHEAFGAFQRLRTFRNGEVIGLQWKNEELGEFWRTEQLSYVADFQVGPLQPRGEPFLVVGTVTEFAGIISSPRSHLVVVPLEGVTLR